MKIGGVRPTSIRTRNAGTPYPTINLDASANAAPTEEVIAAVVEAMRGGAANPSSGHSLGDRARAIVERARDSVISLVGGAIEEGVIFTSGCTEANNTVLNGIAGQEGWTLVTSVVEHPSVLRPAERLVARGTRVETLPVDQHGLVDLNRLDSLISIIDGPVLVSIQSANSETGVLQPMDAVAAVAASRPGVVFHSDAAQAFGKIGFDLLPERGPTIVTISGHKLHAPMGIGAIIMAGEARVDLSPLIVGGEQEHGIRAGTQALPLIAGLATACNARSFAGHTAVERMRSLRDKLEAGILEEIPDALVNGDGASRVPHISSLRFSGVDAMALVANLDARGIAISQGSACSSRRPGPSHVLTAMGLSEMEAFSSVRISVSVLNTPEEIEEAISVMVDLVRQLRRSA